MFCSGLSAHFAARTRPPDSDFCLPYSRNRPTSQPKPQSPTPKPLCELSLDWRAMHSPEFVPSFEDFQQLAAQGNMVPVWSEVLADLETPVSAFAKLRASWGEGDAWLLESVEGGENLARYSFLGVTARASFSSRGSTGVIRENGAERTVDIGRGHDPLHVVEELMARFKFVPVPGLPRFCGGAVGFLGYDCVRFFEKLPDAPPDDRNIDDCYLILTDTVLIFDAVRHSIKVLNNAYLEDHSPEDGARRLRDRVRRNQEDAGLPER